jgi:prephenate dehydrogenase
VTDLPDVDAPASVLVLGAGLLGTSVALALRRLGSDVVLHDTDRSRLDTASALGAGRQWAADERVELAVVAVPPLVTAATVRSLIERDLATTVTDVASAKARPQREVATSSSVAARYVGGHPVAGRERGGPTSARADLFEGRPWVLTPTDESSDLALGRAAWVAQACGAHAIVMTAADHDAALARLSHLPQLVASALAAQLVGLPSAWLELGGQGLRDVVRIARSAPELWAEIAVANATEVASALHAVAADLTAAAAALAAAGGVAATANADEAAAAAVAGLVAAGNAGYERLPTKHSAEHLRFAEVPVVVSDAPGELARLLTAAAEAAVNVEDLRVEHAPGQPMGVVELLVRPETAPTLVEALTAKGWRVHS